MEKNLLEPIWALWNIVRISHNPSVREHAYRAINELMRCLVETLDDSPRKDMTLLLLQVAYADLNNQKTSQAEIRQRLRDAGFWNGLKNGHVYMLFDPREKTREICSYCSMPIQAGEEKVVKWEEPYLGDHPHPPTPASTLEVRLHPKCAKEMEKPGPLLSPQNIQADITPASPDLPTLAQPSPAAQPQEIAANIQPAHPPTSSPTIKAAEHELPEHNKRVGLDHPFRRKMRSGNICKTCRWLMYDCSGLEMTIEKFYASSEIESHSRMRIRVVECSGYNKEDKTSKELTHENHDG